MADLLIIQRQLSKTRSQACLDDAAYYEYELDTSKTMVTQQIFHRQMTFVELFRNQFYMRAHSLNTKESTISILKQWFNLPYAIKLNATANTIHFKMEKIDLL